MFDTHSFVCLFSYLLRHRCLLNANPKTILAMLLYSRCRQDMNNKYSLIIHLHLHLHDWKEFSYDIYENCLLFMLVQSAIILSG